MDDASSVIGNVINVAEEVKGESPVVMDIQATDNASSAIESTGAGLDSLAGDIAKVVGALGIYETAMGALDFSKNIQQAEVLTNATGGWGNAMADAVREQSSAQYTANELSGAMLLLSGSTEDAEEATKLFNSEMLFIRNSGMDLKTGIYDLTQTFRLYGVSTEDSAEASAYLYDTWRKSGIPNADSFFRIMDKGGIQLHNMGFNMKELAAITAEFSKSGLQASDVTLAMRGGFMQFNKQFDQMNPNLAEYEQKMIGMGVATRDANGNLRTAKDVMSDLLIAFGQYDKPDKMAKAIDIFGTSGAKAIGNLKGSYIELMEASDATAVQLTGDINTITLANQAIVGFLTNVWQQFASFMGGIGAQITGWISAIGAAGQTAITTLGLIFGVAFQDTIAIATTAFFTSIVGAITAGAIAIDAALAGIISSFIGFAASVEGVSILGVLSSLELGVVELFSGMSLSVGGITAGMAASVNASFMSMVTGASATSLAFSELAIAIGIAEPVTITYAAVTEAAAFSNASAAVSAEAYGAAMVSLAAKEQIATIGTVGFAGAIRAAAAAMVSFLLTNPIGQLMLIVAAIGAATYAWYEYAGGWKSVASAQDLWDDAVEGTKKNMEDLNDSVENAQEAVDNEQQALANATPGTEAYNQANQRLTEAKERLKTATDQAGKAEEEAGKMNEEHAKALVNYKNAIFDANLALIENKRLNGLISDEEAAKLSLNQETLRQGGDVTQMYKDRAAEINRTKDKLNEENTAVREGHGAWIDTIPILQNVSFWWKELNLKVTEAVTWWDKLWVALGGVQDVFNTLVGAEVMMLNPFKMLTDIVILLWHWITGNSPGLIPAFNELKTVLSTGWVFDIFTNLVKMAQDVYNGVTKFVDDVKSTFENLKSQMYTWAKDAWDNFKSGVTNSNAYRTVKDIIDKIWRNIEDIKNWPGKMWDWGKGLLDQFIAGLKSVNPGLWSALETIASKFPQSQPKEGPLSLVKPENMYSWGVSIMKALEWAVNSRPEFKAVWDALKLYGELFPQSQPKSGPLSDVTPDGMRSWGGSLISGLATGLQNGTTSVNEALGNISGASTLGSVASQFGVSMDDTLSNVAGKLGVPMNSATLNVAKKFGVNMNDTVKNVASKAGVTLNDTLSTVANKFGSNLNSSVSSALNQIGGGYGGLSLSNRAVNTISQPTTANINITNKIGTVVAGSNAQLRSVTNNIGAATKESVASALADGALNNGVSVLNSMR